MISKYLNKNNLHHAYLIEGAHEEIVPEIVKFLEEIGINTVGNSDFLHIKLDSFKIDDARNLKSYGNQKSFSDQKKFFLVTANNILLEAQNSLLKLFEEPIENTHFFVIVPDVNILLPTFVSRFYVITAPSPTPGVGLLAGEVDRFIKMSLRDRIEFIKDLLKEEDEKDEEESGVVSLNSTRARSLKFLNALEVALHNKMPKNPSSVKVIEHILKVREFLRMPGSSTKTLMESVALIIPEFSK